MLNNEMLWEFVPSVTKFALLTDSGNATLTLLQMRNFGAAAESLGILNPTAHTQDELEAAFETALREGAGGMVVGANAVCSPLSPQLVALAERYRLLEPEDSSVTARMRTLPATSDQVYRAHR
jgi:thiamine pyrophosphate-dependent acetolactate synthase large subunit-like protein